MDGTIVQVGLMGGANASVNVGLILSKRITWIGTTLRARPIERKLALSQRFIDEVLPLFDSGALRPVVDSRYAFDEIADARCQPVQRSIRILPTLALASMWRWASVSRGGMGPIAVSRSRRAGTPWRRGSVRRSRRTRRRRADTAAP
jgi:Zinc-binding dehydrogenase